MVFADELVDAVPVVDDVLDGGAEDCDHGDGAYERYQRRGHLVAIAIIRQINSFNSFISFEV